MRLTELVHDMANVDPITRDTEISGLTADSRQVKPGYLFAALPSATENSGTDGRDFIKDAVARGAVAVLAPRGTKLPGSTGDGSTRRGRLGKPRGGESCGRLVPGV